MMPTDSRRLSAAVLLAVVACSSSARSSPPAPAPPAQTVEATLDTPEPAFRVGTNFVPERYEAILEVVPGRRAFSSEIDVHGTLAAPARTVWLHSDQLDVTRATARQSGAEIPLEVVPSSTPGFLGLRAAEPLAAGELTLHIEYTGAFTTDDSSGAFVQEDGGEKYVFTKFEPTDARRVFPSIDEPWSKVPWQLTIDAPAGMVALSNTPVEREEALANGMTRTTFATTPPLPTYLVAFAVGPFEVVEAGTSRSGVPLRVVTPRGRTREAAYAAEITAEVLAFVEDYMGMPYPYAKLDSLAIPRTVTFSAMEHPGLVVYGQTFMLFDPDTITDEQREWYLGIAAHELAHQWFGNYVTPAWWDDLWLNESFATWIGAKAVRALEPAWSAPPSVYPRMNALVSDGLASARMIRQPVTTSDDILDAFDGITYSKGGWVLAMFEATAGEDRFRAAIRRYLEAHAWGVATADDFLAALNAEVGADTATALRTFVEQAGAPVVTASLACDAGAAPVVTLTQQRSLPGALTDEQRAQRWHVPVCVAAGLGGERSTTCTLLREASQTLELPGACPAWVLPNADGAGFYRVGLDAARLDALEAAWGELRLAERLAVFDDARAAARAGALPLERVLGLVDELVREGDLYALSMADEMFLMAEKVVPDTVRSALARRVREAFGPLARKLGWTRRDGDGHAEDMVRRYIVPTATRLGEDARLVAQAVALARGWRELPTRARRTAFDAAVSHSDELLDELIEAAREPLDQETLGDVSYGLGLVRDPEQAKRALALLLEPSTDLKVFWGLAVRLARLPSAQPIVAAFVGEHFDQLAPRLPEGTESWWIYALTQSCDASQRDEVAAWGEAHIAPQPGGPRMLAQALEEMDQCIAERPAQRAAVEAWLAEEPPAAKRTRKKARGGKR